MLYILVIFKDWLLEDDKLVGVIVIFLVFLIGFEKGYEILLDVKIVYKMVLLIICFFMY